MFKIFGRIFILFIGSIFIYLAFQIIPTYINGKNFKTLTLEMSKEEILGIMGNPDAKFMMESDSVYFYKPPPLTSEGIEIYFDSNDQIKKFGEFQ